MNCSACGLFAISHEFSKLKLVRVRCGPCGMTEFRRLDAVSRVAAKRPVVRVIPPMMQKP